MIKIFAVNGHIAGIDCDCGNSNNFSKYISSRRVFENGKHKQVANIGIACNNSECKQVLDEQELNQQLNDKKVQYSSEEKKEGSISPSISRV